MPKTHAPRTAPLGKQWCAKHNEGRGEFLEMGLFPSESYSYCLECKREYQKAWDKKNRPGGKRKTYAPLARLSSNAKKIIVHVPNDEKGRNHVRVLLGYWEDSDLQI